MEDVNISKYRASVVRDGSKPASPGFVVSEGQDPVNPPGTNNYVPYSGATANVELGEYGVEAGFITLDTTPTNTPADQGTIFWDADDETVDIILNGYTMKIGEDLFYPVKNQTGSTIAKGTAVRFNGTVGNSGRLLIAPFIANGSVASNRFMGVTAEEILNGEDGKVLYFGRIRGINTNAFNEGDILYASTTVAGGFQTAIPVAPNNIVLVAAVVTKSINQGTIFVRPTLASNLNTDEAVKLTSVANLDLLQYQSSTGLWENKTIDGAGIVTTATSQVISGLKTFNVNTLMMQSSGNAKAVYLTNSSGSSTYQSGFNFFGFNTDNHIYFAKSSITGVNTGILAWTNTATRTYTLKDASGTLAFTSDIPANPVGGTGTTNYLPKFTGTSTIGNSVIQDNGSLVSIGVATTVNGLIQSSISASGSTAVSLDLRNTVNALNSNSSMYFSVGSGSLSSTNITAIIRGIVTQASALKSDLTFFTNSGDSVIEAMRLTSSGNLGLGVTPSAWNSIFKVLQLQDANIFTFSGNPGLQFTTNAYFDTGFKYQRTAGATYYVMAPDSHQWHIAPSGTAGNAVSFTQAMTLNASGNLLVGTTSDNGARLQVSGNVYIARSSNPYLTIDDTGVNSEGGILFKPSGFNSKGGLTINYSTAEQRLFVGEGGNSYFQTFYTNGFERLRITSGGNVGIGTSSPNATLQVRGDNGTSVSAVLRLRDTNSTSRTTRLQFEDYNGTLADGIIDFKIPTAGSATGARLDIGVDSAIMSLVRGGNVLIGTTTDNGARLQVSGDQTINATQTYTLSLNNTAQDVRMQFQVNGTQTFQLSSSSSQVNIFGAANIPMIFYTNSTERMRITSGGNVLIGTQTDNGARLQVIGFSRFDRGTLQFTLNPSYAGGNVYSQLQSTGALALATGGDNNRLYIDTSGNVGIGTSSPSEKLDVIGGGLAAGNGTIRTGITYSSLGLIGTFTNHDLGILTNGTERMRITSTGNVGIGTSSPVRKLDVNGVARSTAFDVFYNSVLSGFLLSEGQWVGNGSSNLALAAETGYAMTFFTNGSATERMRITSSGNVLIGTTTSGSSRLRIIGLPTSSSGLASGDVWNDGGTLKIV